MTTQTRLMTAEELLAMPDDGYRYELVRGELRKMAPASFFHGTSAMRIGAPLAIYVIENRLGEVCAAETGFRIGSDPDHVRAPDVAFVRREREDEVGETHGYFPGPPDLAIEVISPYDIYREVDEKVQDWLDAGTRMVIVVNPRRRDVTVYLPNSVPIVLTEEDILDGGDVVPGWKMPVAVSVVSLYFKAAQRDKARILAYRCLASDKLLQFARSQLEDMLDTIKIEEAGIEFR